jgi:magnesium-transporting ATPase (P-type)
MLQLSEVPEQFDSVYLTLARQGARVLALAYKPLGKMSYQEVSIVNLRFCKIFFSSCSLKSEALFTLVFCSRRFELLSNCNPSVY